MENVHTEGQLLDEDLASSRRDDGPVLWTRCATSKAFKVRFVEVGAIPPEELRTVNWRYVERHFSCEFPRGHQAAEQFERDLLRSWAAALEGKANG